MEAEAITFQKAVPFIPLKDIMIESESTNTGNKIAWSEIKKSIAVNPEIMHFNALEQIHLISVLILFRLVRKK